MKRSRSSASSRVFRVVRTVAVRGVRSRAISPKPSPSVWLRLNTPSSITSTSPSRSDRSGHRGRLGDHLLARIGIGARRGGTSRVSRAGRRSGAAQETISLETAAPISKGAQRASEVGRAGQHCPERQRSPNAEQRHQHRCHDRAKRHCGRRLVSRKPVRECRRLIRAEPLSSVLAALDECVAEAHQEVPEVGGKHQGAGKRETRPRRAGAGSEPPARLPRSRSTASPAPANSAPTARGADPGRPCLRSRAGPGRPDTTITVAAPRQRPGGECDAH